MIGFPLANHSIASRGAFYPQDLLAAEAPNLAIRYSGTLISQECPDLPWSGNQSTLELESEERRKWRVSAS